MKTLHQPYFDSIDGLAQRLAVVDYIASREIATTVYLGFHLEKPILVEGPAGVGKTELAKGMAQILDVPLIRLQCYEGLDDSKALYNSDDDGGAAGASLPPTSRRRDYGMANDLELDDE